MSIDADGYPVAFPVARGGGRAGFFAGAAGSGLLRAEVRQVSHHAKEAVVSEGEGGLVWRLASDEGAHLKGSDLAPFPLGFFNAGLQADLAGQVARLARARGIAIGALRLALKTAYSLTGSFVLGTGQGVAEGVFIEIDIDSPATDAALADLLRDAVAASPGLALVTGRFDNTFALYHNGRRVNPTSLPASAGPDAMDPFMTYARAPRPLDGDFDAAAIVKLDRRQPGQTITAPLSGRVIREVAGQGRLVDPAGLYRSETALNLPGSTIFAFLSDETAAGTAPAGLALAAAGIAFCYITQICRYIENMKLPIRGVRLVQDLPFARDAAGQGQAGDCDTHLFLTGEADAATFEMLQRVAAHTCYLHQTMLQAPPLVVMARRDGAPIWSRAA